MNGVKFYVGTVCDNKDPDNLNRVKVRLNTGNKEPATDWIRCVTRLAGNGEGLSTVPNKEDEVLVAETETKELIVIGRLWNGNNKPPKSEENSSADFNGDGKNSLNFIKTKSGNKVIFDDTDGDEKIQIITAKDAARIELKAKEGEISFTCKKLSVKAKEEVVLTANKVSVKAKESVVMGAENFSIGSKKAEISASGSMSLKGSSIAFN